MPHSVIFFVRPRKLVFLDDAFQVILATGRSHDSNLAVSCHHLAIKIKRGLLVLNEVSLSNKPLEVLFAFGIASRCIKVGRGRQITLRLAYVKKSKRIARGELTRF